MSSLINWPPSLNSSKLIYGNRGGSTASVMNKFIAELNSYYNKCSADTEDASQASALDQIFEASKALLLSNLRAELDTGIDRDTRMTHIKDTVDLHLAAAGLMDKADAKDIAKEILDSDTKVMSVKRDLDILLLRDQVSKLEYAQNMNEQSASLTMRYADVMMSRIHADIIDAEFEKAETAIIDPDMMPESYETVKELLGL